jgi:hypothetical protein
MEIVMGYDLNSLNLVDNEKVKEVISILSETYNHMIKRLDRPSMDVGSFDYIEGSFNLTLTFQFPPFFSTRLDNNSSPEIEYVTLFTFLLKGETENGNPIKDFKNLDELIVQAKKWRDEEFAKPIPEGR